MAGKYGRDGWCDPRVEGINQKPGSESGVTEERTCVVSAVAAPCHVRMVMVI
jgi:hypothetical protein